MGKGEEGEGGGGGWKRKVMSKKPRLVRFNTIVKKNGDCKIVSHVY